VPAGVWHNVVNEGDTDVKLYSLYAPPEHPPDTVRWLQRTWTRRRQAKLEVMETQPVVDRIEMLVEEEHRLWRASEAGGLTDREHKRLHAVQRELDECYSALRLRRAGAGDRLPADSDIPDPPNEFDGPDSEPPHLEHGVHDDQPAPDPGINPNAP